MPDVAPITSVEELAFVVQSVAVWGYCRVSSDKQEDGQSFDVQQADIAAYCIRTGLETPRLVLETGSAGKPLIPITLPGQASAAVETTPRPIFIALMNRLMDRTGIGQTSHLVVWKLDRLARIATEQDFLLSMLFKRSVRVHSTLAGEQDLLDWTKDPDDPVRRLMRTMLGALAEYERALIRMRTIAGARMKAAKGGYLGGRPPFGYAIDDKELVIDPPAAEVVRRIFYERESCCRTMSAIARGLGGDWHRVRVGRVLENRALYLGTFTDAYQQTHARPDLRILPDGWGDMMDDGLELLDPPEGPTYAPT